MVISGYENPKKYIRGELHTTDALPAASLTLYKDGELTAYTLLATERLVIESVILVCNTAGDAFIFVGADSTVGAGEYVARGTFAANGGVSTATLRYVGIKGALVYAQGPDNATLDAIVYGYILDN